MSDDISLTADAIAASTKAQQAPAGQTWGIVRAVNQDGTLSVESGIGYRTSVPAAISYSNRAIGDHVLIIVTTAGPVVVCAVGSSAATTPTLTVSDAAPGGGLGWQEIQTVWHKGGNLWAKRLVALPPPAGVTVTQTAGALTTYRSGGITAGGVAEQGDYSGLGLQTGLATFGSWAAISGGTATSGTLTIHRRGSGHGYTHGPVTATAFACSATGAPLSPPSLGTDSTLISAALNETTTTGLSTGFCQLFCAGAATAVAFYSGNARDNIEIDAVTLSITA